VEKKMPESFYKVYEFKMAPGSDYTLDLMDSNFKKKNKKDPYDPFLRLEDSKGKKIAEDDDGGGLLNSRIVFRPTREDTYKIIVTSLPPGKIGSYKFTIRQFDLKDKFAAGKVDVLQTFKMPSFFAPRFVDKLNKAGVHLYASGTLFDDKGQPVVAAKLPFLWKNGGNALQTNDQGVVRLALSKENVKDLVVNVPKGHKVLMELTDTEGKALPFKFNENEFKEKIPSAGGTIVLDAKGKLADNDPLDKVRAGCRRQVRDFKMVAGETYTFDLHSTDFDAFLRLEDAAGKQIKDDDDSAGNLNARIVYRATKDDMIRIIITTCDPGESGNYQLTVRQAEGKKKEDKK
jgi:hypothetical protein